MVEGKWAKKECESGVERPQKTEYKMIKSGAAHSSKAAVLG